MNILGHAAQAEGRFLACNAVSFTQHLMIQGMVIQQEPNAPSLVTLLCSMKLMDACMSLPPAWIILM